MKSNMSKDLHSSFVQLGKVARYVLLAMSVLGIAWELQGLYVDLHPIRDLLGEADNNCVKQDLPSVSNGAGMVATAHVTTCDYFIAHGAATTFVYVHKSGEQDSGSSLVFMFFNGGHLDPPRIIWDDTLALHISVDEVGGVAEQTTSKNGVKVSYSIGKEDVSLEESRRIRMHDARVDFIWLILWTAVCVLTAWPTLKQRKKDKLNRQAGATDVFK